MSNQHAIEWVFIFDLRMTFWEVTKNVSQFVLFLLFIPISFGRLSSHGDFSDALCCHVLFFAK